MEEDGEEEEEEETADPTTDTQETEWVSSYCFAIDFFATLLAVGRLYSDPTCGQTGPHNVKRHHFAEGLELRVYSS